MGPHHSPHLSLARQGPHTRQPQAAPAHPKHRELLHYTLLPTSPRTPAAAARAGGSSSLRVEGEAGGRDLAGPTPLSLSPGSPDTEPMECGYALGVSVVAGEEEGEGGMVGEDGSVLPVSFGGFGSLDASSTQACFWGHSIKDYHTRSPTSTTSTGSWAGLRRPVSAPLHTLPTPQPQSSTGLRADLPSPEGRSAPCVPALERLSGNSPPASCAESMSDASSQDGSATPPLVDDACSVVASNCLVVDPLGGIPHWCHSPTCAPALTPTSSLPCPRHAGGECGSSSGRVSPVPRRSAVRSMSADHSSGVGPGAGVGLEAGSGAAGTGAEAGDRPGSWSLSGWLFWWHLDAKQQQEQEQEHGELELEAVGV